MTEIVLNEETLAQNIHGTHVKIGWLIQKLAESGVPEFKECYLKRESTTSKHVIQRKKFGIHKVSVKLSPEIQGFNGKIYFIDLFFYDESIPPFRLAMKTSFIPGDEQKYATLSKYLNTKECNFYNTFANKIPVPMPKVYFVQVPNPEENIPSVILMENLSDRGIVVGYDDYITEEQAKNVVENIAKLHAYIWSLDDESWQEMFVKKEELVSGDEMREWIGNAFKIRPSILEASIERLSQFIDSNDAKKYEKTGVCEDLGIPLVLVHGDLWQNNIIWKKTPDGSASDEVLAFIDWQACTMGNPMKDLARHLVLCLDGRVRKHMETYIIEFYYQKLHEFCTKPEKLEGITVEKLKKAYAYSLAKQAVVNCTYLEMREDPGPDAPMEKQQEYKNLMDKMFQNAKWALDDAIEALEKVDPKWLS